MEETPAVTRAVSAPSARTGFGRLGRGARTVLAFGLGVVLGSCGSPDESPVAPRELPPLEPGWNALPSPSAPVTRFADIHFLDESLVWIAHPGGPSMLGAVYRTTDGGANWERMNVAPGIFPQAIRFATPDVGWLGNQNLPGRPPNAPLYETLDGGNTWHDVSDRISGPLPAGVSALFLLDGDHVFAVGRYLGPAFFVRTNDGGATWTSSDLTPLARVLADVHFFDPSNGIAVGGAGESAAALHTVVLRTEDGGDSWRQVYRSQAQRQSAWQISFPTPSVGYVTIEARGPLFDGIVLKTEDGGHTWREVAVGRSLGGFYGVGFVSADKGWVAGDDVVYRTDDGGASWRESTFGRDVSRIHFQPSGNGYAAGAMVYRFVP